jgi:chromosome segregation ATPase
MSHMTNAQLREKLDVAEARLAEVEDFQRELAKATSTLQKRQQAIEVLRAEKAELATQLGAMQDELDAAKGAATSEQHEANRLRGYLRMISEGSRFTDHRKTAREALANETARRLGSDCA